VFELGVGHVCFSESFESLSEGIHGALWELGGVPSWHRTVRLSAAVNNLPESSCIYLEIELFAVENRNLSSAIGK
jgi:hypothetical protein